MKSARTGLRQREAFLRRNVQLALNRKQDEDTFVRQFVPQMGEPDRRAYRELKNRIDDAEARSATHLGDANAAAEAGRHEKAEHHYARSQYWLDRANRLRGW